ncbi:AAA family ATPase [Siphonobacter curvatus]|uniref:Uncharacterized protein n=1 Tax=Siphonobacter curvatus TaxID=2094562 RepID=A0A2S7IQ97_9BACT|nr:AAA family ATPase [Siphonobacter curvatus]PQA59846.1 hypothetical protein C5O19_09550 [Siphonobacter curvatus]
MQSIKINKLVVYKKSRIVYSQDYHSGLNIIRGKNGSGKSTIANFMYYALGGDFINWLPEAQSCDYVIIEVNINGKILTLKRYIETNTMQPMDIYYGKYENAISQKLDGWNRYNFGRKDAKESFSQIIFKYLNFTEVSTESGDFITFNQILRLLYIDQITPIINIIKSVDFDSPLIRRTIGYYLYGSHDDSLVIDEKNLRLKKKEINDLKSQQKIFVDIYDSKQLNSTDIDKEINKLTTQLEKLNSSIEKSQTSRNTAFSEANKKFNDKKDKLVTLKNEYIQITKDINTYKIEISDSIDFINELKSQSKSLNTSIITRNILGLMPVSYCPSCLGKLKENTEHNTCSLCGNIQEDDAVNKATKVKEEIDIQISESERLLKLRQDRLIKLIDLENKTKTNLYETQKDIDLSVKAFTISYDLKLSELLTTKGEVKVKLSQLFEKRQKAIKFEYINEKINTLNTDISSLLKSIQNKRISQSNNSIKVENKIRDYTIKILKEDSKDEVYESSFVDPENVNIDFDKNSFSIDGRSNFSASSMVVLKNAIRFSIFFASLELPFMRYPRFILCDNIEDKGMEPSRSHKFQRTIESIAKKFNKEDYQIIFTTSMMDESLDIDKYTVGPSYNGSNKSLDIQPINKNTEPLSTNDQRPNLDSDNDMDELFSDLPF